MIRFIIGLIIVALMILEAYPDLGGHFMTTDDVQER